MGGGDIVKKLVSIFLFCLLLFLVACGSTTNTTNDKEPNANRADIENDVNVEGEEEKGQTEVIIDEPLIPSVAIDEVIIIEDYAEITVKGNNFGKRIDPPNPGSFYSYYENDEQGQIFLDTIISVKSLLTAGKPSDEFLNVKIIYDDKYEYETFVVTEDRGGSDFTIFTTIEPLQTSTLHFLASVPEQVENDGKPLKAIIMINGKEYEQIIR